MPPPEVWSAVIVLTGLVLIGRLFFVELKKLGKEAEDGIHRCIDHAFDAGEVAVKRTVRECAPSVSNSAERVIDSFGRTMKDPRVRRTAEGLAVAGLSALLVTSLLSSPNTEKE